MCRPLFDFDTGVISRAVASVAAAIKRITSETISKDFREQINLKGKNMKRRCNTQIKWLLSDSTNDPLRNAKEKKTKHCTQWASEILC